MLKLAALADEWYEFLDEPLGFLDELRERGIRADLFTFIQRIPDQDPKYAYPLEWDAAAVLPLSTYEKWWKSEINDKTRNMVRKAGKKGVTIRLSVFGDEFVRAIKSIYDETPVRQGKPFKHYGKDLETLHRAHSTYLERSEFIGAYLDKEMIGFVKLVHQGEWSSMMQILSLHSQRDKAPTNALLAKAVEICCGRGVKYLQYGVWSRRGIGDFKTHHGFRRHPVARYLIPLNAKGRLMLRWGLHRPWAARLSPGALDRLAVIRSCWYGLVHGS